ncbi:MAG: CotH kinase family protein [Fulvivirga sp.]|uniref:CotH kinase family protein n=3 Tax=Fulvivirga sp. TaxID=1931237 RepID=UPI0032EECE50
MFKLFRYILSALLFTTILIACKDDLEDGSNNNNPDEGEFSVDIGDSEIPFITVDTRGVSIENEPKIIADMTIFEKKVATNVSTIGIEYRGSTSFRLSDKKSFGLESWDAEGNDIKASYFGLPEEEDWILMGHVVNETEGYMFDQTLMYHYLGYEISRNIGKYASRTKFVELELNGEYQGVYIFMEKLKRDDNRIDLSKLEPSEIDEENITGGYILKIDKTSGGDLNLNQPLEYYYTNWDDDARYSENLGFRSNYDINGNIIDFPAFGEPYHENQYLETYFLYEYPAADEIADEQKAYIQNYIDEFETALLTDNFAADERSYAEYIDIGSFVDYFIINELCRNVDAFRLSTYLTKDKGEKLNMGPVWDMNIGFDNGDRVPIDNWVINYNQYVDKDTWMMPFWWPRLLEDAQFRAAIKSRWNSLRTNELSTAKLHLMVNEISSYLIKHGAIERNYNRWTIGVPVDYLGSIESLKDFLQTRAEWMDSEISNF